MFVDPDDYLFPEADQLLYQAVTKYADYDMVLFRWADVCPDETRKAFEIPITDFRDHNDWIKKMVLLTPTMNPCWSRLFRKSIIIENGILFDTTMRLAEDVCFDMEYLKYCETIAVAGDAPLYAYCQNQGSAISQFYKEDIDDLLLACAKKLELAKRKGVSLSLQEQKKMNDIFFSVDIYRYIYGSATHCSFNEFMDMMTRLVGNKEFSEIIYNCNIDSDTLKIKLIKFLLRNHLFGLFWFMFAIRKYIKTYRKRQRQACAKIK